MAANCPFPNERASLDKGLGFLDRTGRFGGALGFEPGGGFGFLRHLAGQLVRGVAFGAQFLDQRSAIIAQPRIITGFIDQSGHLRRLGDNRIQLALRTQPQRNRVFGLDVGDVPVAAIADCTDGIAGGADQLADLRIRDFSSGKLELIPYTLLRGKIYRL